MISHTMMQVTVKTLSGERYTLSFDTQDTITILELEDELYNTTGESPSKYKYRFIYLGHIYDSDDTIDQELATKAEFVLLRGIYPSNKIDLSHLNHDDEDEKEEVSEDDAEDEVDEEHKFVNNDEHDDSEEEHPEHNVDIDGQAAVDDLIHHMLHAIGGGLVQPPGQGIQLNNQAHIITHAELEQIQFVADMGYNYDEAMQIYVACNYNIENTIAILSGDN